jgi:hypothetical protein
MEIFKLKFKNEVPSLFFLVDEVSAAAMPLKKMSEHEQDGTRTCDGTKSDEAFCYNYSIAEQYDRHYAQLLLEKISLRAGFPVNRFAYTHYQAVKTFGKPFEEFLATHKPEN